MATAAHALTMSVEEYLRTVFQPDVDYVDGMLEERNVGEWDHGKLQGILYSMLSAHELEWETDAATETRVQVALQRFRVPDLCVVDALRPIEQIVRTPPLLCVEVVSPEDKLPRLFRRVQDFHAMGVGTVWIFDPETRKVWISTTAGVQEWAGEVLTVEGTRITLSPNEAFARLDRRR